MLHYKNIFALLLIVGVLSGVQAKAQPSVLAGCYSDLAPPERDSGDIVGAGTIRLTKDKGSYSGTFRQLRDDSGEGFPAVLLQDLVINEPQKSISFVVQVHTYDSDQQGNEILRPSKVRGRFTKQGIKLRWQEPALQYAKPNPFLKRQRKCT